MRDSVCVHKHVHLRNKNVSLMFWWDRAPFEILSCVCNDYVDNLFPLLFVCSFFLLNNCVRWNGNKSIKIACQQWEELFICKQRWMAYASHKALCVYVSATQVISVVFNEISHCVFFPINSICASIRTWSLMFFFHLCVYDKLWPPFNRWLLNRTKRRLCQTGGTAATTVLEY